MEFKGATIWLRQTIESDIFYWKPDKWFKIWFFIVNKVNHKDTRLFKRGTNLTTYNEISLYTKATKGQIDQFIRWSKKEQMLTTQKTTRGMIVTVLSYAKYQDYIKRKNDTGHETLTKHPRNINDTINKNDKNDKNEKNIVISKDITPEDYKLSNLLIEEIKKNIPTFKKPNLDSWANHISRMRRLDNRTPEQIEFIIRWCQQDSFWQGNILSTSKLREKFDTLVAQVKRKSNSNKGITII